MGFAQEPSSFFFTQPQPKKGETLSKFPSKYRGLYKFQKDSTRRLVISADSLFTDFPIVMTFPKTHLQKKGRWLNDSMVIGSRKDTLPCINKGDTIYFYEFVAVNVFKISETHILTQLDDYLILNTRMADDRWMVTIIYKENSGISLAHFDHDKKENQIDDLRKIKKSQEEQSVVYLANFKEKDFKKLIDDEWFQGKQYYYKRFVHL